MIQAARHRVNNLHQAFQYVPLLLRRHALLNRLSRHLARPEQIAGLFAYLSRLDCRQRAAEVKVGLGAVLADCELAAAERLDNVLVQVVHCPQGAPVLDDKLLHAHPRDAEAGPVPVLGARGIAHCRLGLWREGSLWGAGRRRHRLPGLGAMGTRRARLPGGERRASDVQGRSSAA